MFHLEAAKIMKLWIDDVRPAPIDWVWKKTTNEALAFIYDNWNSVEHISLDHDCGDCDFGGDYINVLNELERLETRGRKVNFSFSLHSMNPVGIHNMRAIIQRNGWKEV